MMQRRWIIGDGIHEAGLERVLRACLHAKVQAGPIRAPIQLRVVARCIAIAIAASSTSVVERSDTNTRTIEWNMSGGSTPHCKQCQQGGESSS